MVNDQYYNTFLLPKGIAYLEERTVQQLLSKMENCGSNYWI